MKINLAKHGGQVAGMLLGRPPRVPDTDTLAPSAAEELAQLIEAAKAPAATPGAAPGRARDVMSYTITGEDSGHQMVLKQSDTNMSPAFRNLLAWLEQHMK
jgi:hypothetical protein